MSFQDHFSQIAAAYAEFRPRYPAALFEVLAVAAPARRCAWDCATGNGQAAEGLAAHFDRVIATDASREQIASASAHPRISYAVATAESSGLASNSVDLITVAQALHWFDRPAFFAEAARVLVPDGVIAVCCYGLVEIDPPIDAAVRSYYSDIVGPYWPAGRALVEEGYRSVQFPFTEFVTPPLVFERRMTLAQFCGYVRTWSATQRFAAALGFDPVPALQRDLEADWGPAGTARTLRWPLALRTGRKRAPTVAQP
jgi:ubiquinone/menaquinone biosynthesis C-methylase UbiE